LIPLCGFDAIFHGKLFRSRSRGICKFDFWKHSKLRFVSISKIRNFAFEEFQKFQARATAAILAPFQAPRLSAVALGAVTKMEIVVRGGLPPRRTGPASLPAPPAAESAGPDDAGCAKSETGPRACAAGQPVD
jgi:hypothetical protein